MISSKAAARRGDHSRSQRLIGGIGHVVGHHAEHAIRPGRAAGRRARAPRRCWRRSAARDCWRSPRSRGGARRSRSGRPARTARDEPGRRAARRHRDRTSRRARCCRRPARSSPGPAPSRFPAPGSCLHRARSRPRPPELLSSPVILHTGLRAVAGTRSAGGSNAAAIEARLNAVQRRPGPFPPGRNRAWWHCPFQQGDPNALARRAAAAPELRIARRRGAGAANEPAAAARRLGGVGRSCPRPAVDRRPRHRGLDGSAARRLPVSARTQSLRESQRPLHRRGATRCSIPWSPACRRTAPAT